MNFTFYFLSRYFRYFCAVNLSLTLIFTFIEFFEKMMRVSHTTWQAIIYFLSINFLPTFFDYFPVSAWLALFLLIREMQAHNEWETLSLLGVSSSVVFRIVTRATLLIALSCMVGKEMLTSRMAHTAATFKREEFKQSSPFKMYDKWFNLQDNQLCHFTFLDLTTWQGQGFLLIALTPDYTIKTITSCPSLHLDPTNQRLELDDPIIFDEKSSTPTTTTPVQEHNKERRSLSLQLPSLFNQLNLAAQPLYLGTLTTHLFFNRTPLSHSSRTALLIEWLSRILWYLQILTLPLITFLLFCLTHISLQKRWFFMLLPYPLMTVMQQAVVSLGIHMFLAALLFLPQFIGITLIFALKTRVFARNCG